MIRVLDDMVYSKSEELLELLLKNAVKNDQSKTQVDLRKIGTTRVYSPQKYGRDDFRDYMNWLNELDLGGTVTQSCDCWGLVYSSEDVNHPHDHGKFDIAGVHYLEADEGCGFLGCKDGEEIVEIEPKKNRMVIMSGNLFHWVMPGENPESRRIAMAFSLVND